MKSDFRLERANLSLHWANLWTEKAEFKIERADYAPMRGFEGWFWAQEADSRSERATAQQTPGINRDRQTDVWKLIPAQKGIGSKKKKKKKKKKSCIHITQAQAMRPLRQFVFIRYHYGPTDLLSDRASYRYALKAIIFRRNKVMDGSTNIWTDGRTHLF